jgi:hypothetical protein
MSGVLTNLPILVFKWCQDQGLSRQIAMPLNSFETRTTSHLFGISLHYMLKMSRDPLLSTETVAQERARVSSNE